MRSTWHLRVHVLVLLWLAAAVVVAVAHRFIPTAEWLMVHLLMLGGVTTAILIWSAHFTEALRRRPLPTGKPGQAVRLGVHSIGALAVVIGIAAPLPTLVIVGGALVGAVALWHAGEIALAARGALSNRLGWSTWAYAGAAVSMAVGVVFGVLLARGTVAVDGTARLYLAHVSLMMLGWVGLTVMATLITLWPTVLAVRLPDGAVHLGRFGLILMGAGLAASATAASLDVRTAYAAAIALVALGIGVAAWPMVMAARVRPPATGAALHLAAAVAWLAGATLTWAIFVATASGWEQAQLRMGGVVAALVAGGAAQVLLGALTHLFPMVLGGGPHAVRSARDSVERRALARLVLLNAGVALWVLPGPSLVRVVSSVLALAAGVWTMAAILRGIRVSRTARAQAEADGHLVSVDLAATRPRLTGSGGALAAACVAVLAVAGAVAADPAAAGSGHDAAAAIQPTGRVVEVQVEATHMRFTPGGIELEAGDHLIIEVVNTDVVAHDLVLDTGDQSGRLAPGQSARMDVGVVGRSVDGWCSIAGHRQMGMVFTIEVSGGSEAAAGSDEVSGSDVTADSHGETSGDHRSPSATLDLQAPMAREPHDARVAPAQTGTVRRLTLEIENVLTEVAPGVTQDLWTFGGTAPAPTLRGSVGDTFEITLVNDGDVGHSIDFHASAIAPDEAMRTIEPGEGLTYSFVAQRAGAWMYHCSTMPMSLHIANGMYGAVIVDPPDLAPVDREYVLVQSEMYLGADDGIADADKIAAEEPDLVLFNGHATQYREHPLTAAVDERVRVWVVDAGPSRASSFHIVGGQFDTVFHEGAYLLGGPTAGLDGEESVGGAQGLALQPGQGGFVELAFPQPGHYPFVSHIMVDAERGAAGLFRVTDRP